MASKCLSIASDLARPFARPPARAGHRAPPAACRPIASPGRRCWPTDGTGRACDSADFEPYSIETISFQPAAISTGAFVASAQRVRPGRFGRRWPSPWLGRLRAADHLVGRKIGLRIIGHGRGKLDRLPGAERKLGARVGGDRQRLLPDRLAVRRRARSPGSRPTRADVRRRSGSRRRSDRSARPTFRSTSHQGSSECAVWVVEWAALKSPLVLPSIASSAGPP